MVSDKARFYEFDEWRGFVILPRHSSDQVVAGEIPERQATFFSGAVTPAVGIPASSNNKLACLSLSVTSL
jgi:hypothetical protein